jgi:hypothetical protein
LNRAVEDRDASNRGVGHAVGIEERGLRLATIGALAVPVVRTVAIEDTA